jgi:hypothetical protein
MMHVCTCIFTLLELTSTQVMASGTDSGLVLLIPWHNGGSMSSFEDIGGTDVTSRVFLSLILSQVLKVSTQ